MQSQTPEPAQTEAQRKRRERNLRYRAKVRQSVETANGETPQRGSNRTSSAVSVINIKTGRAEQAKTVDKSWPDDRSLSEIRQTGYKNSIADLKDDIQNLVATIKPQKTADSADERNPIFLDELRAEFKGALCKMKSEAQNTQTQVKESLDSMRNEMKNALARVQQEQDARKYAPREKQFGWKDFSLLTAYPSATILVLSILSTTALLISFQVAAYTTDGMGFLALPLAIICEMGLVILAAFFSLNIHQKSALALFVALFSYVLGTMSYDLALTANTEVRNNLTENAQVIAATKELNGYLAALEVATKKQENGNMTKWSNKIDSTNKRLEDLHHSSKNSAGVALIEAKCWGLVALRALLMLLNAFLVHALIGFFRGSKN